MSTLILRPEPDAQPADDNQITLPSLAVAARTVTGLNKGPAANSPRRRFSATRATLRASDADFSPFRIY